MRIYYSIVLITLIGLSHLGFPMFRHWCNTMLESHIHVLPIVSCSGKHAESISLSACCASGNKTDECAADEEKKSDCCDESVQWLADDSERFVAELPVQKDLMPQIVPEIDTWTYSLRQNQLFRDLEIFFLRPPPPYTHSRSFQSVYIC